MNSPLLLQKVSVGREHQLVSMETLLSYAMVSRGCRFLSQISGEGFAWKWTDQEPRFSEGHCCLQRGKLLILVHAASFFSSLYIWGHPITPHKAWLKTSRLRFGLVQNLSHQRTVSYMGILRPDRGLTNFPLMAIKCFVGRGSWELFGKTFNHLLRFIWLLKCLGLHPPGKPPKSDNSHGFDFLGNMAVGMNLHWAKGTCNCVVSVEIQVQGGLQGSPRGNHDRGRQENLYEHTNLDGIESWRAGQIHHPRLLEKEGSTREFAPLSFTFLQFPSLLLLLSFLIQSLL